MTQNQPTPVLYGVMATLPDERTLDDYLDWLRGGHLEDVVRAGAVSAVASRLVDPPHPLRVETRYLFASRAEYESYLTDHAPRLRAQGLARFGSRGVGFARNLAAIEAVSPQPARLPARGSASP